MSKENDVLIITKADTSNETVIINKTVFIHKTKEFIDNKDCKLLKKYASEKQQKPDKKTLTNTKTTTQNHQKRIV